MVTFEKLASRLSDNFRVFSIDLPSFGKSEIGVPLDVLEISELLRDFILKLNINKPIILGHSYGGRIAICYASKYEVKKLILVSSAGVKQKLNISKRLKIKVYKAFKKAHLPVKMGSKDFQNADNVKRIMLVKAVNLDLVKYMQKITAPTLLIYGKNDDVTPLSLAKVINNNIKNSVLIEIDECGHFPYLERFNYFSLILMSFLVGDEVVN